MARRWIESSTDKRTTLLSASSASAGSLLRDRGFFSCLVLIASIRTFKHWYKRKENKRKQKKQSKTAEGSGGLTHGCVVGVGEALVHPLPHELPFVVRKVALDDLVVVLPQLFGGLRGGWRHRETTGYKVTVFVCLGTNANDAAANCGRWPASSGTGGSGLARWIRTLIADMTYKTSCLLLTHHLTPVYL